MKLDLSAIEARANAATKGPWVTGSIPWKVWAHGGHATVCDIRALAGGRVEISEWEAASNRDFISHARADVPALVNAARVMEAALFTAHREHCCSPERSPTHGLMGACNELVAALVAAGLEE